MSERLNMDDSYDEDDKFLGMEKPVLESVVGNRCNYQKMKELRDIQGFVVNIHDVTNFDIDLILPKNVVWKYKNVINNEYKYQPIPESFLYQPNETVLQDTVTSKAYRCRLKGIGVNHNAYNKKNNRHIHEIKSMIDSADGWVTCNVSDIDVYHRLLVDIKVNGLDVASYLIGKDKQLFYDYSR